MGPRAWLPAPEMLWGHSYGMIQIVAPNQSYPQFPHQQNQDNLCVTCKAQLINIYDK